MTNVKGGIDTHLREVLPPAFRAQAAVCAKWGAPTTAAVIEGLAAEVAIPGGALDAVLKDWHDPDPNTALALRLAGAVHRLTLDGKAPALAAVFPSAGGIADPPRAWPLAKAAILAQTDFVRAYLTRPPQTNEVARSAMLLGGFLEIAAATGLPLRLFEMGASAGLNLCWDRYRIETSKFAWGPTDSTLTLQCRWEGPLPAMPSRADVIARGGCDRTPVDLRNDEDMRRLESYLWTDQTHRFERLRRARAIALKEGIHVAAEDAMSWLPRQLAAPHPGATTVVYHSLFWQYLPADVQTRLRLYIEAAGFKAKSEAPVAWLAMEMPDMGRPTELTLTVWPGGQKRVLATVHPHGEVVHWKT